MSGRDTAQKNSRPQRGTLNNTGMGHQPLLAVVRHVPREPRNRLVRGHALQTRHLGELRFGYIDPRDGKSARTNMVLHHVCQTTQLKEKPGIISVVLIIKRIVPKRGLWACVVRLMFTLLQLGLCSSASSASARDLHPTSRLR